MMWMTHIMVGLLFYSVLVKFGIFPNSQILIGLVALGALFPDIDHPKSYIAHLSIWLKASSRVVSLGGHRGITHTIWTSLLAFPLALLVLRFFGLGFIEAGAFFLGYISHLFADSLTVSGVAWFYPFDRHKVRGVIRTGSLFEVLVFVLTSILVLQVLGIPLPRI